MTPAEPRRARGGGRIRFVGRPEEEEDEEQQPDQPEPEPELEKTEPEPALPVVAAAVEIDPVKWNKALKVRAPAGSRATARPRWMQDEEELLELMMAGAA
jgi:hypothetical protein